VNDFSIKKAFHAISKFVSWIFFVILLIAAAFLLYYFVATKIYAAKGPGYEPKFSIYTIVSPSMTPNINVYDAIVNIKVDDPNKIEVGDVITFVSTSVLTPGITITHRVVGITTDDNGEICYRTKGDFNNVEDQACAKHRNVLGKVLFKIPQLGRIQFFLASKAGWLLCILIPALYIIVKDVLKILKLSDMKETTAKITEPKKKDPKKAELERKRKEELKKRLLKEELNKEKNYFVEPVVKEIDKRKKIDTKPNTEAGMKKINNINNKKKKKGKNSKKS